MSEAKIRRARSGAGGTSPHPAPLPQAGAGEVQPQRYEYLRDPAAIYRRSFELIRAETDLSGISEPLQWIALRMVHACAEPSVVGDLRASPDAVEAGCHALARGAPILVDCEMLAHGIMRERLPAANEIVCTLRDARVPTLAAALATTRSAAALELWRDRLPGAVVAIGNAPTALFRLLELIAAGAVPPAVVLGFPVGFVGAAEAKAALAANPFGLAFVTLLGRRGGSALAAAAVNALVASPETT